jgi:hypothetical protein
MFVCFLYLEKVEEGALNNGGGAEHMGVNRVCTGTNRSNLIPQISF